MQKIESWLASKPLRLRRRTLRVLFVLLKTVGYFKPPYEEVVHIAQALNVPIWKAHAIALESIFQNLLFSMEWAALAVRSFDDLLKDAKYVSVESMFQFESCLDSKSLICTTLHSGCYHIAIAYLIKKYFNDRKILIIKNFALSEQEFQAIDRFLKLGFDVRVFTNETKGDFVDMLRCLKEGAVLFMLSDLPRSYGKSTKVEFLDSYADLADGIIDLSKICGAPILFFGVKTNIDGDAIFSDFVLDQLNQKRSMTRRLMAEKISSVVSKEIRHQPHQWQMWSRINEYYCIDDRDSICLNDV